LAPASAHVVYLVTRECSACGRALCQHVLAARLVHVASGKVKLWFDYEEAAFTRDKTAPRVTPDQYVAEYAARGVTVRAPPRSQDEVAADVAAAGLFLADGGATLASQLQRLQVAGFAAGLGEEDVSGAADDDDDERVERQEATLRSIQSLTNAMKSVSIRAAALLGEQRPAFSAATAKLPTARSAEDVRQRYEAARRVLVPLRVAAAAQREPTVEDIALNGPHSVGRPTTIPRFR
jgi:hypothetical protein